MTWVSAECFDFDLSSHLQLDNGQKGNLRLSPRTQSPGRRHGGWCRWPVDSTLHSFGPAPAKIITWDHYALDFHVSFTSLSAGAALKAEKHNLLEVIISFMFLGVMCLLPEPFQIKCKLSVCATLNVFSIKVITLKEFRIWKKYRKKSPILRCSQND